MANSKPFDAYMSSHMMPSAGLASGTQRQKLWCLEAATTQAPDAISDHPSLFASGGTNDTFYDSVAIALASMAAGSSGVSGYPPFYAGTVGEYPPAQGPMKSEQEFTGVQIGLNLGHRIYFPMVRRNAPRCQVEGCINADLSAAKLYHKRHKVCEYHSKATIVEAGGSLQRFCQQCSRFHGLSEFDETKRSCRKRLADHNRRRRKPQPLASAAANDPSAPLSFTSTVTKTPPKPMKGTATAKDVGTDAATRFTTISTTSQTNVSSEIPKEHQTNSCPLGNGPILLLGETEDEGCM